MALETGLRMVSKAVCRDPRRATVSCWDAYSDWERDGAEDVAVRANRVYKERLRHCPDALIDSELDNQLKQYMLEIEN